MFVLNNLREGIQSSGFGGSSTVTIGVCILANELAGRVFSKIQLISMVSRVEQGFGVSITGTQEHSNIYFWRGNRLCLVSIGETRIPQYRLW